METEDCYTCRQGSSADAPPREDVAHDEHWRVAHAFNSALVGWLVLLPRRHVTTIAELTPDEAQTLGSWLRRLSVALHAVTGCEKTYVMQFSEAAGFHHLHFHVVPRDAELPTGLRGPRVFGYLDGDSEPMSDDECDAVAGRLSHVLDNVR